MTPLDAPNSLLAKADAISGVARVWADHHTDTADTLDALTASYRRVETHCLDAQETGNQFVLAHRVLAALRGE